jgi:biopolymer transport protein TolR
LVISINESGKYFLNLGEEQLPISLIELKNKAKIIYQANPDIEIVFKSDANVPFNFVAKAMASIQSLGIEKVGIVTSGYDN